MTTDKIPDIPGTSTVGTGASSARPARPAHPGRTDAPAPDRGRIDVRGLTASYGGRPAIADVDITLQPGKVTAFIGPSGCGKTTLLRCINGLHMTIPGASVDGISSWTAPTSTPGTSTWSRSAATSGWCSSAPTRSPPCPSRTT